MSGWMEQIMVKHKALIRRCEVIEQLDKEDLIDGKTNQEVYQEYLNRCNDDISIIGVSRIITKYFDYKLYDMKIKGVKKRVFVK